MKPLQLLSILALSLFLLAGCKQLDNFSSGSNDDFSSGSNDDALSGIGINLDLDFSAISKPSSSNQTVNLSEAGVPAFAAQYTTNGFIKLLDASDTEVYSFEISGEIDDTLFEAQIFQTLNVIPGSYKFVVVFSIGTQQYMGETTEMVSISDGTNDIPLTIKPVIGDTLTTATVTSSLGWYTFDYVASQLGSLTNPELRVWVDGSSEGSYLLDASGDSTVYFILDGLHSIIIELWSDESPDVKKAANPESDIDFTPGTQLTINLTPLFGETTFILTETGGDAVFDIQFPGAVADSVDGILNLDVTFSLTGNNNHFTDEIVTVTGPDASGDYAGNVNLTPVQYDSSADISLTFLDNRNSDEIGNCSTGIFQIESTSDINTPDCAIALVETSIIAGDILNVLKLYVNPALPGEPVAGAHLYITHGAATAIHTTASGDPADRFVQLELVSGSYSIYATDPSGDGTSDTVIHTAEAWAIDNLIIDLN